MLAACNHGAVVAAADAAADVAAAVVAAAAAAAAATRLVDVSFLSVQINCLLPAP